MILACILLYFVVASVWMGAGIAADPDGWGEGLVLAAFGWPLMIWVAVGHLAMTRALRHRRPCESSPPSSSSP